VRRDLREPMQFGMAYLQARKGGVPIETAVLLNTPRYRADESCIEKYGPADEVDEVWERIRIK
jgi:hypothetical protein